MKVLVVGMCPSNKPLLGDSKNASLVRLSKWMDTLNVNYYSFINTFDYPASPSLSKVDYKKLSTAAKNYDNILALGGFVSLALERHGIQHFKMPHPSPLNRQLNDKKYESKILKECKEYLK